MTGLWLLTNAPSSNPLLNTLLLYLVFLGGHAGLGAASLALATNMAGWADGRGWVRTGNGWLGGAIGGLLLAVAIVAGIWTLRHGVRITWFCWLAGLPHLLLSARRLDPDAIAPLPVALRRAGFLVVLLLAIGLALQLL